MSGKNIPTFRGPFSFFDLGQTVSDNPRRHCWQEKYLRLKLSPCRRVDHMTKRLPTLDPRPRLTDVRERLAERDRRIAADNRTEIEKYLGIPERARSALAQRSNRSGTVNSAQRKYLLAGPLIP
jgi:hypothetical protein